MRMATACGAAPAQIMRYMQASWEIQQTGMRLKGSVQIRMRLQLDQMEILQAACLIWDMCCFSRKIRSIRFMEINQVIFRSIHHSRSEVLQKGVRRQHVL